MNKRKIVFLTGTRADFGKVKSLIQVTENSKNLEAYVFVTGMHMLEQYGLTRIEVERCGFQNICNFNNATSENTMDLTLAKTIEGFSGFVGQIAPDLIVVHGDRVEALAGAIVGSLNNILVAHIEGGEISGTVDELIRHAVSKLSHIHFAANDQAAGRLIQMGELPYSIKVIGSPDIDIMFSKGLPSIDEVKNYYAIPFKAYAVVMFHPVTTEYDNMGAFAKALKGALLEDDKNYVVIYPNNDLGSSLIIEAFREFGEHSRFRMFPSIRFEYFLTLLKNAQFIIGNSSAGIREAPYYGIPSINVGTRQENRSLHEHIIHTSYKKNDILRALNTPFETYDSASITYGTGESAALFLKCLESEDFWEVDHQKQFLDVIP